MFQDPCGRDGFGKNSLIPLLASHLHTCANQLCSDAMNERELPYRVGKTWTTDAPYRETVKKIQTRRAEGCLTVEMESAALIAVAQFRGVTFGQALYGGDDLSGGEWDNRQWQSRSEIRENLFWLCADACLSL